MMRLLLALALLALPARAFDVIAPRDGGFVLGDALPLQVDGARVPPQVSLDGVALTPRWTRARTGSNRWVADVRLGARGAHRLEVWSPGQRVRVAFSSGLEAVDAGDLVVERALATLDPRDLEWNWGPAVQLHGLLRFAPASTLHGARATSFVREYHARWLAQGPPAIDHADRCPPALTALALARDAGDRAALPNAERVAAYLRREPRNALGALDHLGSRSLLRTLTRATRFVPLLGALISHWAHSIWLDSLFMYAQFAAQWGAYTGDAALLDFGLSQPAIFARVLQDPRTGLFHHAWDVEHARPMGCVWLRGNAWVAAAVVDLLETAPANHPRRAEVLAVLGPLLTGLLDAQDEAGLWTTVLDDRGTYQESSGSALAAYAVAKAARLGYASASLRARARPTLRALTARLRPRAAGASVTGTSVATSVWPTIFYRFIPRQDDVAWGVGAYLMLAHELRGERWDVP